MAGTEKIVLFRELVSHIAPSISCVRIYRHILIVGIDIVVVLITEYG